MSHSAIMKTTSRKLLKELSSLRRMTSLNLWLLMRQPGKSKNYRNSSIRSSNGSRKRRRNLRGRPGSKNRIGITSRSIARSRRRWGTLKSRISTSSGSLQLLEMDARQRLRRSTRSYHRSLRPRARQLFSLTVREWIRKDRAQSWQ